MIKTINRYFANIVRGKTAVTSCIIRPVRPVKNRHTGSRRDPASSLVIEGDMIDGVRYNSRIKRGICCPVYIIINGKSVCSANPFPVRRINGHVAALVVWNLAVRNIEYSNGLLGTPEVKKFKHK